PSYRDHAVSGIQSRPHAGSRINRADRPARRGHADHRPLRQTQPGSIKMAHISIRNLKKQFGQTVAVSDFSLDIADGELVTFLGPSGCGKTTTLRMVAGFIAPTAGSIHIGD